MRHRSAARIPPFLDIRVDARDRAREESASHGRIRVDGDAVAAARGDQLVFDITEQTVVQRLIDCGAHEAAVGAYRGYFGDFEGCVVAQPETLEFAGFVELVGGFEGGGEGDGTVLLLHNVS
ncbi:hypothetical protein RRF57_009502 [Xylaria bambusicola]|uniref:Uncharacterized protein n=1 Tax=Xylaria bambusicola TaxID=326684 RepID=A0AAN7ZBZ9_9PEZI